MNTTKLKLTLTGICGLMLVPFASHAGTATQLNDNTVLFTVDFSFYDDKFALEVPIMAENGVAYNDRVDTVGYTVESEGDDNEVEKISALVLSRSAIEGNRYAVETGTESAFTLMVLATFTEPVTSDKRAYITKIPYWLDERRTTVHTNQLDDIEPALLNTSKVGLSLAE